MAAGDKYDREALVIDDLAAFKEANPGAIITDQRYERKDDGSLVALVVALIPKSS